MTAGMDVWHLWEYDHPSYRTEHSDYDSCYQSWAEFTETWLCSGPAWRNADANLLFRWDWARSLLRGNDPDKLSLAFVCRHEGILCTVQILVWAEDEPAVREWLAGRAKTITAIWEPIGLAPEAADQ